jgi:hypothetical protein
MKKLSEAYKELGIDFTFPIEINDTNGSQTYYENSDGYWNKREYDSNGNKIYFEDSYGYWCRYEYDSDGNKTYRENSWGYWCKCEYDDNGNRTYYEDSDGYWNKSEYDANGNLTYYEDSEGLIEGTPRSQPSETLATNDEIAELKAQLSELRKMLAELHEVNAELHKEIAALRLDRDRIDFLSEDKGAITSAAGVYVTRKWNREYTFRQAVDAAIIASNFSQNNEIQK